MRKELELTNPAALIGDGVRVITALGNIGEHAYNLSTGDVRDAEAAIADLLSIAADLGVAGRLGGHNITRVVAWLGGAEILDSAITVMDCLEQAIGVGTPDSGVDLGAGATQFTTLAAQLEAARPGINWQGSGSQAYVERTADHQDRAQQLAGLDRRLAEIIDNQARWVVHARLALAAIKAGLAAMIPIALALAAWERATGGIATAAGPRGHSRSAGRRRRQRKSRQGAVG